MASLFFSKLFSLLGSPSGCVLYIIRFVGGSLVKNLPIMQKMWIQSLGWEDPLEKEMATQPTPVFFLGKPHGRRSLAGYSP